MFTLEQKKKIAEALNEKKLNACPSCGKVGTYTIGDAFVMFPLQEDPKKGISLTGSSYLCVPVLCSYCGFSLFYNVVTLGLAEFFGITATPAAKKVGTNG